MEEMARDLIEDEAVGFLDHLIDLGASLDDAIDIVVVIIAHILSGIPDSDEAERRGEGMWNTVRLNLKLARAYRETKRTTT